MPETESERIARERAEIERIVGRDYERAARRREEQRERRLNARSRARMEIEAELEAEMDAEAAELGLDPAEYRISRRLDLEVEYQERAYARECDILVDGEV